MIERLNFFKKIPIRLVLVVPFTLEIFAAVGLIGWLSFLNGQLAINQVTKELRTEITARIQLQLQDYLNTPLLINQINANSYKLGQLDFNDLPSLEKHFWQQMQLFNTVSYISLGTENGDYIGIERVKSRQFRTVVTDENTKGNGYHYDLDEGGNRIKLVKINQNYDPRKRPWYQQAKQAKNSTWTEIYPVFSEQQLTITASQPIYNQNNTLEGVIITDLILSQIDEFLRSLKLGKTGQTFIIERNGMLVASSTPQKPFLIRNQTLQRIHASQAKNPLISETTNQLIKQYKNLNRLGKDCTKPCTIDTKFYIQNDRQFVQITPILQKFIPQRQSVNLPENMPDWLIVVVIPESDFTEQINANTRTTILLSVAAFFVALLLGLMTSRWIVKPILKLNSAASALAQGDWHQMVPGGRLLELNILGRTFNQMTQQLKTLYSDLEQNLFELIRVQDALRRNEANYRELVQNANSMIVRLDTTGHITFFNEFAQSFFGYSEQEILGQNIIGTIVPTTESTGRDLENLLRKILNNPEQYSRIENENIRRSGDRVWVSWTIKALRNPHGNLTDLLCIGSDISDRKRAEDALKQRERYLNVIVRVQRRLLANNDQQQDYTEILESLGKSTGASRVYCCQNHLENGELITNQICQWVAPENYHNYQHNWLKTFSLNAYFPSLINQLSQGNLVRSYVKDLPMVERQFLEPQGIISILILPLIVEGEFFGFIGFENCTNQNLWEALEVDLLAAAAAAFALYQERVQAQLALQEANAALEKRVAKRTAQLAQSETRFRRLSEATFEGIVLHNSCHILDKNEAFLRMFGYQVGEESSDNLLDYVSEEFRAIVLENIAKGYENSYEIEGIKKDKTTFPIEIEAKIIPYEGAQVRVAAVRDITERKQAEKAIRESEEKFSTAFRQSPNAITITSLADGIFIDISGGFVQMMGYQREQVLGKSSIELNFWVHPEDRQRIYEIIKKEGRLRNYEIEFRTHSGDIVVGLFSAEKITIDGVDCLLSVTSDITERRRAQEALARALKEQESIFEAQQDIIFVFDLDLNLVKWNKQMELVTGLNREELKGRSALSFFLPEDHQTISQGIINVLTCHQTTNWSEGHILNKNGTVLNYQFSGVPLKDEKGNIIGFTGAGRDITEAKRAAAILQAERENSERLLLNILPQTIAERLKKQTGPIAESFLETTVLFADIVGFTQLSSQISPQELVDRLNEIFSSFDQLTDRHGLEKIKTIGDAYMAVCGVPVPRADHAQAVANMALDMKEEVYRIGEKMGFSFNIRIGINTGPVVAGVIGLRKFIYDLWGDTVNTASRMESQGIPGEIQVTTATYAILKDQYIFQERGTIQIKGKGEMKTYFLTGQRNPNL